MTACSRHPDDDVVVRYVTNDLPDVEQSGFEDHMFACDACLARVEWYQSAQLALAARSEPATPVLAFPAPGAAASAGRPVTRLLLAAAATLVVGTGAALWLRGVPDAERVPALQASRQEPASASPLAMAEARFEEMEGPPADSRSASALKLAVLAMVTPPPYLPITTRGDSGDASFATGMAAYVREDWPAASQALREVGTPAAQFYRGVAELMRGDARAAAAVLDAARISGQQPYARESQFYLAKAALHAGDLAGARTWLTAARDADAGPSREAERLLAALADVR